MSEMLRKSNDNREQSGHRDHGGRKSILQELAGLTVVVVAPGDDQTPLLIRELQRLRITPRQVWPMPESVPSDADLIYCEYSIDLALRLPWIPGDARAALVVILPSVEPVQPDALANATPDAVLSRPFTSNAVVSSLILARSQFRYEQRLRSKIERLDENLRSMRTVERAKAILMETRRMPENEAYAFIRRQAMDRRVSASSVAGAIVDSFELLGYNDRR